jgi:tetratricopeptide (TPR) repeat protein
MSALHEQGRYKESLDICLQIVHAHPEIVDAWGNVAVNCARLGRWQDVIEYGQAALVRGSTMLGIYDSLAHAHGHLEQWDKARRYGLQALSIRDSLFGGKPVIPLSNLPPLPPLPCAQTRERNIISFSLFGGNSKYCEPAVLNVQEQPKIYPNWVCRFYVDGSVPENVINRIRAGGGQVAQVNGAALQWPGPMWRLLALDDPQAHRILFRDADSVISQREADAVEQWLTSEKRFHMMRDWYSHTELMLAGLWGIVAGSLPPLDKLMECFMSAPLQSRNFADQFFLRQYVWPYARTSIMQHDSVFGFMDAASFPSKKGPEEHNVGYVESSSIYHAKSDLSDGSEAFWELYRIEKRDGKLFREERVCCYPCTIKDGFVNAHIPERYVRWIEQGTAQVHLVKSSGKLGLE